MLGCSLSVMAFSILSSSSFVSAFGGAIGRHNRSFVVLRQQQRSLSSSYYLSQLFGSSSNEIEEETDPGIVNGLSIVKYPHPALRNENEEIAIENKKVIDEEDILRLSKDMLALMYQANGVGLAAPQVGRNVRMMVYNASGDPQKWLDEVVLINPKIVATSEGMESDTEGCLSFPNMNGEVSRHKWIKVEAMNTKGKKIKRKYEGWEARIFQHEYDHLDGIVYIDRLPDEERERVQPRLNELIEEFGEGGKE